jgi:GNAT superfamily N-acetyltransferase
MSLFEHDALTEAGTNGAPHEPAALSGTEVRALGVHDVADVQRMLTALDRDSRCARFGWAASDTALATHAETGFANAAAMFGVFVDRQLRGVLEIYQSPSGVAEVALVVAQDWRRRGLGWMMLQAAMRWTNQKNVGTIVLIFSRHNWAMRQLTAKASAKFDIVLDEISAEITAQAIVRPPLIQLAACRQSDPHSDVADASESFARPQRVTRLEYQDRESA